MTTDAETTEGQAEEQSQAINQLDDSLQQISATFDQICARLDEVNARLDQICARIDRLTYMIMGIGGSVIAIEIGITITLILQRSP